MFRTDLVSITNVYQLKLCNGECTGLGDYIRGSLCLLQICNQFHIEFGMHMKNHPISNFFKSTLIDTPAPPEEIVKYTDFNYNPVSPFFLQHFIQFINNTTVGPHVYIHCISFPIHETKIPNTLRMKIYKHIVPIDGVYSTITYLFQKYNIQRKQYGVIHIRWGDYYLLHGDKASPGAIQLLHKSIIQVAKQIILLFLQPENSKLRYVLMCDYIPAKAILKKILPQLIIMDELSSISHIASPSSSNDQLMNTLIEFYLLCFSRKNISFSAYQWGSGFSYWSSFLHNVPIKKLTIE